MERAAVPSAKSNPRRPGAQVPISLAPASASLLTFPAAYFAEPAHGRQRPCGGFSTHQIVTLANGLPTILPLLGERAGVRAGVSPKCIPTAKTVTACSRFTL